MNNKFILVVDDNPTNLSIISQALRSVGWQVRIAVDGEDALNKVAQNPPELILLDVQMPKINGFEVCQRLKADPTTADIPIIFMTALADTTSKVNGLSVGAVDYITKPFEQQEAIARIRVHLQLRHLTQTLEEQVQQRTSQLSHALEELQHSQLQLIQSEKMSALGNLVAGVAHEINNPIGFLNGSIHHAEDYLKNLLGHLALYQKYYPSPVVPIQENAEDIELDYLIQDFSKLLTSMSGATDRIKDISTSLSTFSRADTDQKISANLHEGIESTLLILKYRLKANEHRPAIEVIQNYGEVPAIKCFYGQLNQVFMNIFANAIDVFDEAAKQTIFAELNANPQKIMIQTTLTEKNIVEIQISDNGQGMPEGVKDRIFDHLFTTKEVGKGTGLGLAIARQIVVEKHGGTLDVQSELGQGTTFYIRLPIEG